jgi:DNA (cytosine-5)-methyltransferase 1
MKVGSMFAGIGGFDLGFERAGFEVAWCIEWDKNAQAVLRKRFPEATIYGDIREVDPAQLAPVDVVCGGFPCQDLSVAGKRAGLAGERSGLFHDAMRLVRQLNPKLLVLENVPGLLSSNHGLDFATVLREVGEGWDCEEVAWRVLDSQYFGVAQRRRRVFVVASSRIGCSEEVLALAEGSGGDPPSRGKAREVVADDAARCADVGCWWDGGDCAATLTKKNANGAQRMPDKGNFGAVLQPFSPHGHYRYEASDQSATLQDRENRQGGHTHLVAQAFRKSRRAQSSEDDETWVDDGLANTLNGFDTGDTRTTHAIATPMTVRRLTPVECERLQGFPDGWTQIGTDEKPTADSHRYKQLGNAVTVNVAEWIARRAHKCLSSR